MSYKIAARFLVLLYFLAGLFIFSDFGISWDEEAQRINNGLVNYNYLFEGKKQELIVSPEKYHGPAFELLLISVERVCKFTDTRSIYLMRHLLTFLTFFISSVCIYFLSLLLFKKEKWALFAFLFYILSPRIFAESFYNSKDLPFLSLFAISLLTFYQFTQKKSFGFLLLHAVVTGFMIDIRITGILIPMFTIVFLVSDFFFSGNRKNEWKRLVLNCFAYILLQTVFIVLFWPVLWEGPVFHFMEAFRQMSRFPWDSEIRYYGEIIQSLKLPWHYAPVWILISTPVLFLVVFVSGIIVVLKGVFSFKINTRLQYKYDLVFLCFFFIPLLSVIILHSIVYDGWRHLYFLHVPLVLVGTRGIMEIYEGIKAKIALSDKKNTAFSVLVFVAVFGCPAFTIIKDHPNENVYFNPVALKVFSPMEKYFEMDYWGLSYRKGLEYILSVDSSASVKVHAESKPGKFNLQLFKSADRARFEFIDNTDEPGIYYLADFRGTVQPIDTNHFPLIHTIENSSGILMRVYKRTPGLVKPDTLLHSISDFEDPQVLNSINPAHSGKNSFRTDSIRPYSSGFKFPADYLMEKSKISLRIKAWVNSTSRNPNVMFVLAIDRGSKNIYWAGQPMQGRINEKDKWLQFYFNPSLPNGLRRGDYISVYLWNMEKKPVFFDDLEISVVKYIPLQIAN